MADHRDYLDEQYKIAVLDYKCAHSEADQLHQKYLGSVK